MNGIDRYSSVAVVLHWVIAILIIGQIAGGWYMHRLPNAAAIKFDLYQLHKSFGVTIILLTLARLGWRLGHKPPALPAHMAGWEKFAARATHWLFYVLLIMAPLTGWAMVSASPTDIPTKLFGVVPWPHMPFFEGAADRKAIEDMFKERHEFFAYGILVLLALHVGAALKHHFFNKDAVLVSMAPRTVLQTVGVAGLLGAFLLAGAAYWTAPSPVTAATPAITPDRAETGDWIIDKNASRLSFVGREKDKAFRGEFTEFDAVIQFDPDNLAEARIDVTVMTASATTNDELRDSNLPGDQWFDIKDHPTAAFVSTDVVKTDDGEYQARGTLKIKEFEKEIRLPFTLAIEGDKARAEGEVALIRTDFGLGADSGWLDEEGVALEVAVMFEVHADRRQD